MPTKGPSNRYGNTSGSRGPGKPAPSINFQWAKGFSKPGLAGHFKDHGKEFGAKTPADYAARAIHFANTVDRQHFKSVVDYKGTTYKYDPRSTELAIITQDGYVVSYHQTGGKFWFSPRKGIVKWILM